MNGYWRSIVDWGCIIKIYASCNLVDKRALWDSISPVLEQNSGESVIVGRDFNAIRTTSERRGKREENEARDIIAFNEFINQSGLIDLPLCGRTFTWYRSNASCKSWLERILVKWGVDIKMIEPTTKGARQNYFRPLPNISGCVASGLGVEAIQILQLLVDSSKIQRFLQE